MSATALAWLGGRNSLWACGAATASQKCSADQTMPRHTTAAAQRAVASDGVNQTGPFRCPFKYKKLLWYSPFKNKIDCSVHKLFESRFLTGDKKKGIDSRNSMETLLASVLYVSYVQGKCAAIHKEWQAKSRVERKAGTWDEISCGSRPEEDLWRMQPQRFILATLNR
jgi:hypothetical protein